MKIEENHEAAVKITEAVILLYDMERGGMKFI